MHACTSRCLAGWPRITVLRSTARTGQPTESVSGICCWPDRAGALAEIHRQSSFPPGTPRLTSAESELTDGCFRHWVLLLLPSYTGWSLLFLALASLIYLPKEPAGAAVRAPSALDVPADWLEAFQSLVNSAYHSVFTFLVRVERIYSDSWLSSSLVPRLGFGY